MRQERPGCQSILDELAQTLSRLPLRPALPDPGATRSRMNSAALPQLPADARSPAAFGAYCSRLGSAPPDATSCAASNSSERTSAE